MTKLVNRAKMTTATTGTGTITLGSASSGYQSFADAGIVNGDVVRYVIEDGVNWEIGTGTYTASGTTLSRTVSESSNSDNAITLSGTAIVYITAVVADILQPDNNLSDLASASTARTNLGLGSIATQAANNVSITGGSITGITDLAVSDGGTGASSFTANNVLLGNNTSAFQVVAPGTTGNVLTSNGTTWVSQAAGASLLGDTDSATPFETSLGFEAGANTTGTDNTFIGYQAGKTNTSGTDNTAVGYQAGTALTTGSNNVAIGSGALDAATTGGRNVAIGLDAMGLGVATAASGDNIAIGYQAGNAITSGTLNILLGQSAGLGITTGAGNIAIGVGALDNSTAPSGAIAIGGGAIGSGVHTGQRNIAIGDTSGWALSSGESNVLLGYRAGFAVTTGSQNIAIGPDVLDAATTGGRNIAIGSAAMGLGVATAVEGDNIAIGFQAGYDLTSGTDNILLGEVAGSNITTGTTNVAIGLGALLQGTTGSNNVAIGNGALDAATTGGRNIAIGQDAMGSGVATAASGDNIAIGYQAGFAVTSGTDNIFIGETAGDATTTGANQIVIGQGADASSATVSNEITLGNTSITKLRVPGLGIDWTSANVPTASDVVKLSSTTVSTAVSSIDFTLPSGYAYYSLVFRNVEFNGTADWAVRVSTDGGSTFLSGATDYTSQFINANNTTLASSRLADSVAYLSFYSVASGVGYGISGRAMLFANASGERMSIHSEATTTSTLSGNPFVASRAFSEVSGTTSVVNAIRLLSVGDNITSGIITLYGHKA
jgi:hypothetical protein